MEVLFIGDIHGKSDWITYASEALKKNIEIVFLGDYVDSFDIIPYKIEQNLYRIIALKKKADFKKKKITLLLGNHDYAYIKEASSISGYNFAYAEIYHNIFNKNWNLFDLAWGYENIDKKYTLVTHAGLTKKYWNHIINDDSFCKFIKGKNKIHEVLNILKDKFSLLWKLGYKRNDGSGDGIPSIIWADIEELKNDFYPDINQIIGHTGIDTPEIFFNNNNFIAKIDGEGKDVKKMIINL